MPFQICAKNIFLTYAQCPLDKHDVQAFLIAKFPDAAIRVGHELHADEGKKHGPVVYV